MHSGKVNTEAMSNDEHTHEEQAKALAKMLEKQQRVQWTWKVRIIQGNTEGAPGRMTTRITRHKRFV